MNSTRPKLKFRFLTIAINEEIFSVVRKGMDDAASAMGVDAELDGTPGVEAAELVRLTRKAVADGVDGIALNLIQRDVFNEVIAEAKAKHIPALHLHDAVRAAIWLHRARPRRREALDAEQAPFETRR